MSVCFEVDILKWRLVNYSIQHPGLICIPESQARGLRILRRRRSQHQALATKVFSCYTGEPHLISVLAPPSGGGGEMSQNNNSRLYVIPKLLPEGTPVQPEEKRLTTIVVGEKRQLHTKRSTGSSEEVWSSLD